MDIDSISSPVQRYITKVEERMRIQSDSYHPELTTALNHLLSSGGKRLRPILTLLTGKMLGCDIEILINLAAAIELLHTATLVHDDLIDGAMLRRGIPTLNARWTPAATVLTGDVIFAQAAHLASMTNSIEVMQLFAKALMIVVNGEITQMFDSQDRKDYRASYYQRIYSKTASVFEMATTSAAMLSEVDIKVLEAVKKFGYEIGMAFQIVDDILDFTGEQETVGKPVASDLRQGLVTLPTIYYMEANPTDLDLETLLSNSKANEKNIKRLVKSIRNSNAIEDTMCEARQFVGRGIDFLSILPPTTERHSLERLAHYIVQRSF